MLTFRFILAFALVLASGVYVYFSDFERFLAKSRVVLDDWVQQLPESSEAELELLDQELRQRFAIYEENVQARHLMDGMVVNRRVGSGEPLDLCDSLLFSSLRYVALDRMGYHESAQAAWKAIVASSEVGRWVRHPRCQRGASRDMIIGLLLAISRRPSGYFEVFNELLEFIETHSWFVSEGPAKVSWLTPSLAELIRRMARSFGIPHSLLPDAVRQGFSTAEFQLMVGQTGYRAHLSALMLSFDWEWQSPPTARSVFESSADFSTFSLRHQWLSGEVLRRNGANLFFLYLHLRATGLFNDKSMAELKRRLLNPQWFPADRLPQNCDRRADYLWQRGREEYVPAPRCTKQFAGVDFLWMASLLVEATLKPEE